MVMLFKLYMGGQGLFDPIIFTTTQNHHPVPKIPLQFRIAAEILAKMSYKLITWIPPHFPGISPPDCWSRSWPAKPRGTGFQREGLARLRTLGSSPRSIIALWDFLQPGGGQENSLAVILPPKAPQTQSSWSPHSLVCWPARWPWPTWWAGAPTLSRGAWGNVFQ